MLKVTVSGSTAAGKTTLALLIAKALTDAGLVVENTDDDVAHGAAYGHLQNARVKALAANGTAIVIETVQVRRGM